MIKAIFKKLQLQKFLSNDAKNRRRIALPFCCIWLHRLSIFMLGLFVISSINKCSNENDSPSGTDEGSSLDFSFSCVGDNNADMELPLGYSTETIWNYALHDQYGMVRSEDGTIFVLHAGDNNNMRISILDVNAGRTIDVLEFDEELRSGIYGGPNSSFFTTVGREIRQYDKYGNYTTWATLKSQMTDGCYYGQSGTMYTTNQANVYTVSTSGDETLLATNLGGDLSMVEDSHGEVFIADVGLGKIHKIDKQGNQTVLTDILADKCFLALSSDDLLYGNNLWPEYPLAQIDKETGTFTNILTDISNIPCTFRGADSFVILDDGKFVFVNWSYFDPQTQSGDVILENNYQEFADQQMGPDGKIYARALRCNGNEAETSIVEISEDGALTTIIQGVRINRFALDDKGGAYVYQGSEGSKGLYYYQDLSQYGKQIPSNPLDEYGSIVYSVKDGHLYAQWPSANPAEIVLHEYSDTAFIKAHVIMAPESFGTICLAADPKTGTVYAAIDELERYNTGPDVMRWILKLDLEADIATIHAQQDLIGHCCPFQTITVDTNGDIWWVLAPDFWVYQVTRAGQSKAFACHVIQDASTILSNGKGTFFLFHPGGIDKILSNNLVSF